MCLNPLKRVNSILTIVINWKADCKQAIESQSPQAGQFNSYKETLKQEESEDLKSQSPQAGQFNSY